MGTNVYFYKKVESDIKNQILEDLETCGNLPNMKDVIDGFIENHPEYNEVHIGKRSAGWQFLFAREILNFCEPNKESILNWLSTGIIQNEYGETLTPEKFWQEYVVDFQYGMDYNEYYKKHPEDHYERAYDEIINGLRFTTEIYYFS